MLIRPEQITLSATSSPVTPAIAGAVSGKVTQTRYHGHDALIAVDVPESGLLQVRTLGTHPPAQGDEVSLTVSGPVMAWQAPLTERDGEPGPVETRRSQGTV